MNRVFKYISWLTLLLSLILVSLVFYWLVCPYEPIEFLGEEQFVETKEVSVGGYLVFDISYCKKESIIPLVSRSFVDGIIYTIPESVSVVNELGCRSDKVQIYVPKALPPGEYYLKSTYKYQVNPLRSVIVSVKTERFLVTK